jgi:2-dehydropantoate 2-reductase
MDIDPEVRMAETRRLGAIKSSMLQDVEAGRPLETEGLLGTLVEIAGWADVPAPRLELLAALVRLKEQVARGGRAGA